MPQLVSVQSAAAQLGLSIWTIYRWASTGYLKSIRLGRRRLFDEADLQEFVRLMKDSTQEAERS